MNNSPVYHKKKVKVFNSLGSQDVTLWHMPRRAVHQFCSSACASRVWHQMVVDKPNTDLSADDPWPQRDEWVTQSKWTLYVHVWLKREMASLKNVYDFNSGCLFKAINTVRVNVTCRNRQAGEALFRHCTHQCPGPSSLTLNVLSIYLLAEWVNQLTIAPKPHHSSLLSHYNAQSSLCFSSWGGGSLTGFWNIFMEIQVSGWERWSMNSLVPS